MTIAVYHSKGGVGKTSTVVHLARLWQGRGVTVYDLDHQQATRHYAVKLPSVNFVYCDAVDVAQQIDPARVNILDCPPFPERARPAFRLADLVLIPFTSERVVWREVEACRADVKAEMTGGRVAAFLSRYYAEKSEGQAIRAKARQAFGSELLPTAIRNLSIFDRASWSNETVLDFDPSSLAARKIAQLGSDIDQYMGGAQ